MLSVDSIVDYGEKSLVTRDPAIPSQLPTPQSNTNPAANSMLLL